MSGKVAILIPALNEALRIREVVQGALRHSHRLIKACAAAKSTTQLAADVFQVAADHSSPIIQPILQIANSLSALRQ